MVEDVVDVDSSNSFVVKFEVKEFARFLEFTLINSACWTKESVMSNIQVCIPVLMNPSKRYL
jgi:hypothetical protein